MLLNARFSSRFLAFSNSRRTKFFTDLPTRGFFLSPRGRI